MVSVINSLAIIVIGMGLIFNTLNIHELVNSIESQVELNQEQLKFNKSTVASISQLSDREIERTEAGR